MFKETCGRGRVIPPAGRLRTTLASKGLQLESIDTVHNFSGFFEPVSHSVAGCWDIDGPHWRMSESPAHIRLPAPTFSEHNRYVFGELLGLSDEEIAKLETEGVTGTTPNRAVHD